MTKRNAGKFKRNARDKYDTPESAVVPLMPFIMHIVSYWEPCAGNGFLTRAIKNLGGTDAVYVSDITAGFLPLDARTNDYLLDRGQIFITNPPWTREVLHPIIANLSKQAPTWLLFDADWMHTKQAIPYLKYCEKIVSVGRVSWMGNGVSGFDNCAWYLFDQVCPRPTQFYGRAA